MASGNSYDGTLTSAEAVEKLTERYAATPVEDDRPEAAEAVEENDSIEDGSEVEANEVEAAEVDDDVESADSIDADATGDDTADDIDAEELNKGYLRQADYTRKTQELAQQKAALDAQAQSLKAQAEQQLERLKQAVETYAIPTEPEPNWPELARTMDPKAYLAKQAEWSDKQAKAQQAAQLAQQIKEAETDRTREQEANALLQRIPEWKDPKVLQSELAEIVSVASEFGYSPDEVTQATDHRNFLVLRELMAKRRQEAAAKKQRATPAKKPKAAAAPVREDPKQKDLQKLNTRLKKSGSPNDAAALLMARRGLQ